MIRFSGFEIDKQRAELRDSQGSVIKVRPKTFEVLRHLAAHARRIVSKQELMETVWPNVYVSDDSLFQCIKELRSALGDTDKNLIKAVSGRGYLLDAETVTIPPPSLAEPSAGSTAPSPEGWLIWRRSRLFIPLVVAGTTAALLAAGLPALLFAPGPSTLAVTPIIDASGDRAGAEMSAAIEDELIDGLARIDGLQVVAPAAGSGAAGMVIASELRKTDTNWVLKARLMDSATGQVHGVATTEIESTAPDQKHLQTRLAAGIGDQLARSLNLLRETPRPANGRETSTAGKVAIEQASASISQTSPERFAVAETMLAEALRAQPDNIDLQVALASMQLRGLQMAWYGPDQHAAVENNVRSLLESALEARPRSIAALEAQCRLLSTLTEFAESLVACGQVLAFDPWNGSALYLVGLGQLYLGRFEDALVSFTLADRYDTPAVSRWTWRLGAGWANLMLGHDAEAVQWLESSIAITPASGRSHMLLAVAYHRLGRMGEASAALAQAMQLRPHSTMANVLPTSPTMSPVFLAASQKIIEDLGRFGMPRQ